jgi:hypothetical protein
MAIPVHPPKKPLKIHPTPFKSSLLSIPTSPFSPVTPLSAHLPAPPSPTYIDYKPTSSAPMPRSPLRWLWTCHQCHHTYALGVTRRCLEDGHFFCAGVSSTIRWRKSTNRKKKKTGRACRSEFDYAGWKCWRQWKNSGQKSLDLPENPDSVSSTLSSTSPSLSSSNDSRQDRNKRVLNTKKDCWKTCDYPSECRWGRRYGIHTSSKPIQPLTSSPILSIIDTASSPAAPPQLESKIPTTSTRSLKSENVDVFDPVGILNKKTEKKEKKDFWSALARAARRRGSASSSPLARGLEDEDPSSKLAVDKDGDAVMSSTASLQRTTSASSLVTTTLTNKENYSTWSKSKRKRSRNTSPSPRRQNPNLEAASVAVVIGQFEFSFDRPDEVNMDFAPLERMNSRDCGYYLRPEPVFSGGP